VKSKFETPLGLSAATVCDSCSSSRRIPRSRVDGAGGGAARAVDPRRVGHRGATAGAARPARRGRGAAGRGGRAATPPTPAVRRSGRPRRRPTGGATQPGSSAGASRAALATLPALAAPPSPRRRPRLRRPRRPGRRPLPGRPRPARGAASRATRRPASAVAACPPPPLPPAPPGLGVRALTRIAGQREHVRGCQDRGARARRKPLGSHTCKVARGRSSQLTRCRPTCLSHALARGDFLVMRRSDP